MGIPYLAGRQTMYCNPIGLLGITGDNLQTLSAY